MAIQIPRLRKEDTADINVDELEAAEYSEQTYASYGGEIPPNDTILTAYVKAIWWTRTGGGSPMLKVLVIADDNEGELEEYNGLPSWENMGLSAGAKFKWAPFFSHFGFTIRDVKNKIVLASDEDDNIGAPISKIGDFVPGSDESWCRIITSREKYNGAWQAHVQSWLPYEDEEPEETEDEPEVEDDVSWEDQEQEAEEDEDEDEDEDVVEEVPAPPPARRGRAAPAAKAPAAAKTSAKTSNTPAATSTRATAHKPATAASGPAKARAARTASVPSTPTAAKRGRRAAGSSDDPPF